MTVLLIGLLIFLGTHSIGMLATAWREAMTTKLGPRAWKGLYSLLSLLGFALIVYGFGLARQQPVVWYQPQPWMRHLSWVLMLPVFPLLFAANLPGRIKTAFQHPMLAGAKFWALAHLLANGRAADVLLFGSFLVWAVFDRISWKRRPPQMLRTAPARPWNDALAIVLGLAAYALFMSWAHVRLFGVAPLGYSM